MASLKQEARGTSRTAAGHSAARRYPVRCREPGHQAEAWDFVAAQVLGGWLLAETGLPPVSRVWPVWTHTRLHPSLATRCPLRRRRLGRPPEATAARAASTWRIPEAAAARAETMAY